ncbi:Alkyl hydroperoxide reductase AhpD [Maribacter litoralis]|uniref:Alkyl hydroperoxide reductase AhpD n=1 Tax=Maribacter litoralis TaxID=2059726 RepID=A0A653R706_9FLAO|nr:Alkyl hydroperoxide reductase AhpD [Maribacter litoralis]
MLPNRLYDTYMDKEIKHMGTKAGKLLLFGGVYSNLQALEKLIQIADEAGIPPENCISTGDLTGYCAQPEETVQLFQKWGALSIAGNVELQLANDSEDCGCDFKSGSRCDDFSKMWFPYTKGRLSKESLDSMKNIPEYISFDYGNKKVTVVHGNYGNTSEFIFKSNATESKERCFKETKSDIIIAGHCGLPFHQTIKEKVWLNPGVIGMPANDGTPRVWYMMLDIVNGEVIYTHHSFEYDAESAQKLMYKNHLPEAYGDTLTSGIWDNMEILPELEKMGQGIPIYFNQEQKNTIQTKTQKKMANTYYDPADLRKFGKITEWSEELGTKFFDYYGKVFEEGALSAREKSLIALAVSHVVKCPYCIDAYTKDGLQKGITKEEMMEAVHVGAAIEGGATLVHGVQMMNKYNKLSM